MPIDTLGEVSASIKFGFVVELDEAGVRVKVRLPDYDDMVTDWLQVLMPKTLRDKHYFMPDLDEHVAILVDPLCESGVVLGAVYSKADRPPVTSVDKHHVRLADGGSFEYDRASGTCTVVTTGPCHVTAGGAVTVDAASTITITAQGPVSLTAPEVTVDSPLTTFTGNVLIKGLLTCLAGIVAFVREGEDQAAAMHGSVKILEGDVTADNISLKGHRHTEQGDGAQTSAAQ